MSPIRVEPRAQATGPLGEDVVWAAPAGSRTVNVEPDVCLRRVVVALSGWHPSHKSQSVDAAIEVPTEDRLSGGEQAASRQADGERGSMTRC